MYPTVSAILKNEAIIKATLLARTGKFYGSDDQLCTKELFYVLDHLDAALPIKIDRFEALNLTVCELALYAQQLVNDMVHQSVADIIVSVLYDISDGEELIDKNSIKPLTLIVDSLRLGYYTMIVIAEALEERLGIIIEADKIHSFKTIAGLEFYINKRLSAKQPPIPPN